MVRSLGLMRLDHDAIRRGSGRVAVLVATAGVALGLLSATGIGLAGAGVASVASPSHGLASGASAKPLAGKIIGIDPGHNGLNYTDPAYLNHKVWNGREWEDCDTTGTETASGYTEARFNWNVARYLRAILIKDGAKVVLTRHNNHG